MANGGIIIGLGTAASGVIASYLAMVAKTFRGATVQFVNAKRYAGDIVCEVRKNNVAIGTITVKGHQGNQNFEANEADRDVAALHWFRSVVNLVAGDVIEIVLVAGTMPVGTSLRAKIYSKLPVDARADNLAFIRPYRVSGPMSNDNFPVQPTYICKGNQIDHDPKCAPQNPSNIMRCPETGKLVCLVSFYSRDEQHGGGRTGNTARVYGYQSKTYVPSGSGGSLVTTTRDFETNEGGGWTISGTFNYSVSGGNLNIANSDDDGRFIQSGVSAYSTAEIPIILGAGNGEIGLEANYTDVANRYFVIVNGTVMYIRKIKNGGSTVIGGGITVPCAFAPGDRLRLDVTRNALNGAHSDVSVYVNDGLIVTYVDTTPLGAGRRTIYRDYRAATIASYTQTLGEAAMSGDSTLDENGNTRVDWEEVNGGNPFIDLIPNSDQSCAIGDPFILKTLDGKIAVVYDTADGTDFDSVTTNTVKIKIADSFLGLIDAPAHVLFTRPNTGSIAYCPTVLARPVTNDYVFKLGEMPGFNNRRFRTMIIPNLAVTVTPEQFNAAPITSDNNEEGGAGFVVGTTGYSNAWQVAAVTNAPSPVQRIYKFPLADAINPGAWEVDGHSWGHNDPRDVRQDGGRAADSDFFWHEQATDLLFTTFVAYSQTENKNYVLWSQTKWTERWRTDKCVLGVPLSMSSLGSIVDIPVAPESSFEPVFTARAGEQIYFQLGKYFVRLGANGVSHGQILGGNPTPLAPSAVIGYAVDVERSLKIERNGNLFKVLSGSTQLLSDEVTDADTIDSINAAETRWTIVSYAGSYHEFTKIEVRDALAEAEIAPVASFTKSAASGTTATTFAFTDTSINLPTAWEWAFGDGSTSTARNPSHNFAGAGIFTVMLTATNAFGSSTTTQAVAIVAAPVSRWNKIGSVPRTDLEAWLALDAATSGADGAEDFSGNAREIVAASNAPMLQTIAAINNQKAVYFDGSTTNPLVYSGAVPAKHIFIVASYEDAAFPADGYAGLLTGIATGDLLIGSGSTDLFYNYAYPNFEYKKNDVGYLQSNQKAPVSGKFGIIEISNTTGFGLDGIQIGQQKDFTDRKWKGWFAESLIYSEVKNDCERLAVYKYLAMKFRLWRQTAAGINIFPFPNSQRTPGQSFVNALESTSISGAYKGRTKSGLIRSFDVNFNVRRQEEWDAAEAFWFANKNKCVLENNSFYPARQYTGRITTGISHDPQSINNSGYKFGFVTT